MALVIRVNYGDESIALLVYLSRMALSQFQSVYVVYVDTGWASYAWRERVEEGEALAQSLGFHPIRLTSKIAFDDYVRDRKSFPNKKFQWCAGFLKGLPLLEWLDEHDSQLDWTIALPKRQALYRQKIEAQITECQHHGERTVWHPMHQVSHDEKDALIRSIGFEPKYPRSLECEPCVHSQTHELQHMHQNDRLKTYHLEVEVQKPMFPQGLHGSGTSILEIIENKKENNVSRTTWMDRFSMGCGDPFGCGL